MIRRSRPLKRKTVEDPARTDFCKESTMNYDTDVERLLETCLHGERAEVRACVTELLSGQAPDKLLTNVVLPAIERIERLDRDDRVSASALAVLNGAMRLAVNRMVERLQAMPVRNDHGNGPLNVSLYCGASAREAMQGEIMAAILEHDGHHVRFGGGGVPADEILSEVGRGNPDLLLLFASSASDGPAAREVIDTIRSIGSRPDMQIVLAGGIFSRAPGLAEEIGADLWTDDPEALRLAIVEEANLRSTPEQRTVGRGRRIARAA